MDSSLLRRSIPLAWLAVLPFCALLLAGCGLLFGTRPGSDPERLQNAAMTDIKELEELVLIFRRRRGVLPESLAAIRLAHHVWEDCPVDPWGKPYFYVVGPGRHGFLVGSFGADGARGGRGFDRDLDNDLLAP